MKIKILLALASIAMTALILVGVWGYNGLSSLEEPVSLAEPRLFVVDRGASYDRVAYQMEDAGLVDDAFWLRLHGRLNRDQTMLRAGTYEVVPGMAPLDLVALMVIGRTKSWPLQLIEGWTFADVRRELARHEHLEQTTTDLPADEIMAALDRPDRHPEGMFFPDTYHYEAGETDLQVLRRALARLEGVLEEEWRNRAEGLPYETAYEALIMASLVEKETGVPYERAEIAGVFTRRLDRGMRLQTDPTVIYGLGERYVGNLSRSHLLEDNEYNTYRRGGLPPTPIALAGQAAIHAAVHPAEGDTLYFVARGDGSHAFSETLAEHQEAVQRYQIRNRREDYRSSPGPAGASGDE